MENFSLFRKEVLKKKLHTEYGTVCINTPTKYSFIAVFLTIFVTCLLLFINFTKITEHYPVKGYINSYNGIANVYPLKIGLITSQYVKAGDKVEKGDILFVVDTSISSAKKSSDEDIIKNLLLRKKALQAEIKIDSDKLASLKELLDSGYVSLNNYNDSYKELLELQDKEKIIDLEIIKYRDSNSYSLRANTSGIVTNVLLSKGQFVNPSNVLAQIKPINSELFAELYIPVEKAGFLNIGNAIFINYDAYSSSKFGRYKGIIKEISESILTDKDEIKPVIIGKPYYKARAYLEEQTINFYGKKKHIQQGMTITAIIDGQKRTILEWMLDPLFIFYGKYFDSAEF